MNDHDLDSLRLLTHQQHEQRLREAGAERLAHGLRRTPPPKQRAVLLLRDVLAWSAKEVAEALEETVAAVTSALQRARKRLEGAHRHCSARDGLERALVKRFMAAWTRSTSTRSSRC